MCTVVPPSKSSACIVRRVSAILGGMLLLGGCEPVVDAMTDGAVERAATHDNLAMLQDGKLHVILLGTGTPQADPSRGRPAIAVAAAGEVFLFDAGDGTSGQLDAFELSLAEVQTVFVTHWHSDHFAGLGQVMNHTWYWGRDTPMHVYGPAGVDDVLNGIAVSYALDIRYRTGAGMHRSAESAFGVPHEVNPADGKETTLIDRNGVRVTAFRVDHNPVEPAVGYRVDYRGRSVVISGDTRITEQVEHNARGADLLVHVAVNDHMLRRAAQTLRRLGRPREALEAERVIGALADSIGLAQLSERAGVEKLVLTHMIPSPPSNRIGEWVFTRGMDQHYHGEIIVGRDGMHFAFGP